MKIIIEDEGNLQYSRNFPVHPSPEEAVFSACYLLSKIYLVQEVKTAMIEAIDDL